MVVMNIFEWIGTIAFAAAGALVAIEKQMDIFGVLTLALTTAVGGGMVRDLMVGVTPPTAIMYPTFTLISLATAIFTCIFYKRLIRFNNIILISDAIGLGAFTAAGANLAFTYEFNRLFVAVMMGLLTGVGGGVVRDVFAREIPFVFQKEVYAVASIAGAIALFYTKPWLGNGALYVCFLITVGIRMICMKYDVHLPVINTGRAKGEQSRDEQHE